MLNLIVNKVQTTLKHSGLISSGYTPRSGIAGAYGISFFFFLILLKTLHTLFDSSSTNFHFHQHHTRL